MKTLAITGLLFTILLIVAIRFWERWTAKPSFAVRLVSIEKDPDVR